MKRIPLHYVIIAAGALAVCGYVPSLWPSGWTCGDCGTLTKVASEFRDEQGNIAFRVYACPKCGRESIY